MPINDGDIKLLASQRLTDNSDGGGMVTGTVIVDGVSNNLFPDIAELDRTYGRVNLRKVFPAVQTADTDGYFGAHLIVADAPDDPRVSATLFSTRNWTDSRTDAVNRLESYLARGPRFQGYLYDQHIAGQRALLLLMRPDRELPAVGATLALVKNPGLSSEETQFVRVTRVNFVERTFSASGCNADFKRLVVTLEISDPLLFDLEGGQPHCLDDTNQTFKSKVYTTVVANAAKYYGIRPLAQAAATGDFTLKVDSIFSPLVPSAQTEIPIVDVKPNGDAVAMMKVGTGAASITTSAAFSPANALFVGGGIYPGSLTINGGGYALTDKGGVLMNGTSEIGTVDYGNGIVRINTGGPTISGTKTIGWQPAAAPSRVAMTRAVEVTPESRSGTLATLLDPPPAPGTLVVAYYAQGRWYVLRDDGSGAIRGGEPSHGSGQVNFTTGSVVVTMGALPDVGSAILLAYGVKALEIVRAGGEAIAYQVITLPGSDALVPNTVTLTWPTGKTATDDGLGNLTGDATGRVNYADRKILFAPNVLPPGGATITVTADTSPRVSNTSLSPTVAGTNLTFTLGTAIRPKTLLIKLGAKKTVPADYKYKETTFTRAITLTDDGAGNVRNGATVVGTVNYATGDVTIPKSFSSAIKAF